MHHQPDGPAFDIVLILHVGCVVVSLVTLVASIATASRLRAVQRDEGALPDSLVRYFRPGVNWAGRSLYGIPVFGFLLLALSRGSYSLRDGWVMAGLAIFVVMILLAEGVLWPAERRLQMALVPPPPDAAPSAEAILGQAQAMVLSAIFALTLLVLGSALMLVQP